MEDVLNIKAQKRRFHERQDYFEIYFPTEYRQQYRSNKETVLYVYELKDILEPGN
jgi:hypothetical protein